MNVKLQIAHVKGYLRSNLQYQGWLKSLTLTNTLAYFGRTSVKKKKIFVTLNFFLKLSLAAAKSESAASKSRTILSKMKIFRTFSPELVTQNTKKFVKEQKLRVIPGFLKSWLGAKLSEKMGAALDECIRAKSWVLELLIGAGLG